MVSRDRTLKDLLATQEAAVLGNWMQRLRASGVLQTGRVSEAELDAQARTFLGQLVAALGRGATDPQGADFQDLRLFLADLSRTRALQGYSPSETATFVLSLKEPLFTALRAADMAGETAAQVAIDITLLLDQLALQTVEAYQRTREEVILRQHREIAELSTPVVKLWQGILALPLIGTLDSERTQVVMENLLQSIVDHGAAWAIIDITGVPTVDTLTAQHLLKTVAAARLMGADCIISGIRPQIAQTLVHLGVDLDVVTKASLADAFATALRRLRLTVAPLRPAAGDAGRAV